MPKIHSFRIQGIRCALTLFIVCGFAWADTGQVTVAWDPIQDSRLGGYTVQWGQASKTYDSSQNTGATQLTLQLTTGKTYYFAVRGYDKQGEPGDLSAEVSALIKSSGPDTTPPTISGVSSSGVAPTTVIINWATDEASDSQVEYGKTAAYGSATALNTTLVTSHSTTLAGLTASTTYHYRVKSKDAAGNMATSGDYTFATLAGSDSGLPVISKISVDSLSAISAIISFTTDKLAFADVDYGKTPSLGSSTSFTNDSSTSHSVRLSGLSSSTKYYFQVVVKDPSGNIVKSDVLNFQTNAEPNATLKFVQITLSNLSPTSVTINWSTNMVSGGTLDYGTGNTMNGSLAQNNQATEHSAALTNLPPSTVYHYRIRVSCGSQQASSDVLTFKTGDRINQLAKPSSAAIFVPSVAENASIRTNLGIDNLSDSIANVTVTLVGKNGLVMGANTYQVPPLGLTQINSVIRSLTQGTQEIEGNLYLESDQPVSAWASQIDNSTNDPSILISKRTGSTQILIPSAANTSKFTSSLVIMNLGMTAAQVGLKAYGVDGSILGETHDPLSIAPNGILTYDNVLGSLGVTDNYGPIEINSLNGNLLVAASRVASKNRSGGFFEGINYTEASLTPIIPHVVETAQLRTNLGINNVSDSVASVTVRLINKDGQEVGAMPVTVAAKGLTQINSIVRQLSSMPDVTEGYLKLESNQPVIAWTSEIDNVTNDPGFAVSKAQGAAHLLVGSTANVGVFKSSLVVVNTGDQDATVDIVMHDSDGNVQGQMPGLVIPAHGFYNTQNILESLGVSQNFGPVEIDSSNGQLLVVVSRVYSTSGTSGFFEGLPLE